MTATVGPAAPRAEAPVGLPLSRIVAVGLGNALDFYDFLTYSFFATQIGQCFFPAGNGSLSLLLSLATFGVGFVTRPLGGVVIGRLGDRIGRKPAMLVSFGLMGSSVVALAATPSYASIGMAAPILLVLIRLIQGFALGGEVGPSTAYLIEAAPLNRRGLYVAIQSITQEIAVLSAGLVGFTLSMLLDPPDLTAWGWRIAMLLGVAIVPVGIVLRSSLPETLPANQPVSPVTGHRLVSPRLVVLSFLMLGAATIGTYSINYMATFAQDSLRMTSGAAFGTTIVSGLCGLIAGPLAGSLTDRVGRRPVMLTAGAFWILLAIPLYWAMVRYPSVAVVYGATAILSVTKSGFATPTLIVITESLPRAVRSATLSTIYALSIGILGGTTQMMLKLLGDATGSKLAPGWYMTGAVMIGAIAVVLTRESAPVRQRAIAGSPVTRPAAAA